MLEQMLQYNFNIPFEILMFKFDVISSRELSIINNSILYLRFRQFTCS